jgi:hypothetical protein
MTFVKIHFNMFLKGLQTFNDEIVTTEYSVPTETNEPQN